MAAIEFDDVRVSYRSRRGRVTALAGLELSVPEGGVFGFLGANGAGKTTAIRAAVGLLRGAEGKIRLLGADSPRRLHTVIDRVGAIVEQPSFFANFTGRQNLELLARARGLHSNIDDVLDQVELLERADSRCATYSLGMKQRLAIAGALLKDPDLLIFDEPANGLDPAGMMEVRTLMRTLADDGRTVFVSSHILSEVEQTCDHVAIVAHGRCVTSGKVDDLLRGSTGKFRVKVANTTNGEAVHVLAGAGWKVESDDGSMIVGVDDAHSADVTRCLASAGLFVSELTPIARSLEDVFLELTEEGPR